MDMPSGNLSNIDLLLRKLFMFKQLLVLVISLFICAVVNAAEPKYQLNASLFMLANLTDDSPEYGHLDLGFSLGERRYLGVEFITWTYSAPLGIPYGDDMGNPDEDYPGSARGLGAGITYQQFFGTSWFAKVHATPLLQTYTDLDGQYLQQGFQLFVAARAGYRWTWFNDKIFLEPSIAVTSWPINTNLPTSFLVQEDKWSNYFLFEPGLNIGFRF